MTKLDDTLPAKVLALVATYGKVLTFYTNAGEGVGTYDAANGRYTSIPTVVTYDYKTSPPTEYMRRLNDVTAVDAKLEVTLPASGLNATFESDFLRVNMRVDFDSIEWRAVFIEPIYSGELVAAYRIGLDQHSDA